MKKVSLSQIESIVEELKLAKGSNASCDVDIEDIVECLESSKKEILELRQKVSYTELEPIVDRKFIFLALNPFTNNCYSQKDAFIMCAKDRAVPAALKAYIEELEVLKADPNQIKSTELLLSRIIEYQKTHITKVPDIITVREVQACILQGE